MLGLYVMMLSVCLFICLSVCLFVCVSLCVRLCVCLAVYLSVCLFVCPFVLLSVCLSTCPSVCLSVCLYVCASFCLSVRMSVRLFVCLSVCPSVCPSVRLSAHPPPPLTGTARVTTLKILGVTFTNSLSVAEHVHAVTSSSSQTLYALRILRAHGMDDVSLQTIFHSVVRSKLMHASSAPVGLCWCIRLPASCSVHSPK